MRPTPIMYAMLGCAFLCIPASNNLIAQSATPDAAQGTCAGLLADNPGVSAIGPGSGRDTSRVAPDSSRNRPRADSAAFGIGGARTGQADIILWVGVHADQVRFAKQPNIRVRLCWGGDTLRVVQRDNLPSPIVVGTTYRNVFVAVELIGRINAECLADRIGVGNTRARTDAAATSVSSCAFLGGSAGAGTQTSKPPAP